MARCPFAAWRPLPENATSSHITPRIAVFHTMVGTLRGTENYFRTGTGIESHFGVGCPKCDGGALDGVVWQWMDTNRRADANLDANGFAISVETCDHYSGGVYTNPPLSPKQIQAWIRLGLWAADVHDIPRRRCNAWNGSGFGYHSMWGAPSPWTPAAGKTCPNPTRIRQFNETVLPAIVAGRAPEEEDMPYSEDELKTLVVRGLEIWQDKRYDSGGMTAQEVLRDFSGVKADVANLETQTQLILDRLTAIEAKLP